MLGEAEQSLYHHRPWPAIRTRQRECALPRVSILNFCILSIGRHLETVHLHQAHSYKLNVSVGNKMAPKVSCQYSYFHASSIKCRLLTLYAHITGLEELRVLQDLANGHGSTKHVDSQMLYSVWQVVCIINVPAPRLGHSHPMTPWPRRWWWWWLEKRCRWVQWCRRWRWLGVALLYTRPAAWWSASQAQSPRLPRPSLCVLMLGLAWWS